MQVSNRKMLYTCNITQKYVTKKKKKIKNKDSNK